MQDLRFGAGMLAKSRGFTAVAVLSLALGIGVNTAVFSVIDAMLFRPFPYDDPDRLVMINLIDLQRPDPGWDRSPRVAEYLSWKQRADVFEEVASYQAGNLTSFNVASARHPTEQLWGASVSTNLFATLGVEPLLGRGFLRIDGEPGSEDVVIVSHDLWQQRFGPDAKIIGETLWLNRTAATIVGVMPSEFRPLSTADTHLWVPTRATLAEDQSRVGVAARLAPGFTFVQAQVAMDTLAAQRAEAFPETNDGWGVRLVPIHEYLTWNLSQTLFVLWGAVGFVLLIACANVAGVLLARASARTKEVATRLALGASLWRVARLFFVEGVLLALAGGALGSVLAYGGVQVIQVFNPDANPLTLFPCSHG